MNRDPQMLMSIQIACIGIVIVIGFFYIWRALSRIENKIDNLACQFINNACILNKTLPPAHSEKEAPVEKMVPIKKELSANVKKAEFNDDDEEFDEVDDFSIMKTCFGDIPIQSLMDEGSASFMIFNTMPIDDTKEPKDGVLLEEMDEKKDSPKKQEIKEPTKEEDKKQQDENNSLAETESSELSKNKLKKLNLDALKDICQSRGLSTDGVKNTLIDRIVTSMPSL